MGCLATALQSELIYKTLSIIPRVFLNIIYFQWESGFPFYISAAEDFSLGKLSCSIYVRSHYVCQSPEAWHSTIQSSLLFIFFLSRITWHFVTTGFKSPAASQDGLGETYSSTSL